MNPRPIDGDRLDIHAPSVQADSSSRADIEQQHHLSKGPNEVSISVRLKAARLRAELEAGGAHTVDELVDAALGAAKIKLEPFAPGIRGFAPNLKARLHRTRVYAVVYISQALKGDQRAFAIAHEIGHYHLHEDSILDDVFDEAQPGDPARSNGYSTREVKEQQADAFAAEFLCPSTRLRGLLADGLRASVAASHLDVSSNVVLRQAALALLEPPAGSALAPADEPPTLDKAQTVCRQAPGPLLAVGGRRSGKTTALIARIRGTLDAGYPPASSLFLVRSEEAAAAARAALSYSEEMPASARAAPSAYSRAIGELWIGTFAGLAFEIVVKWPGSIGRTDEMRILDPASFADMTRKALADLAPESAMDLRRAGKAASPTPQDVVRATAACRRGKRVGGGMGPVLAALDAALQAHDALAPSDLLPMAVAILRDDAIRTRLQDRFRRIVVDDLQDAPEGAVDLLCLLATDETDIVAAGDPGPPAATPTETDGAAVLAFAKRFGAKRVELIGDYRRRAPIDPRRGPDLVDRRVAIGADADAEARAIRDRIERFKAADIPYRAQALLARTHAIVDRIATRLAAMGVPMLHLGDIHRRSDVRTLVAVVGLFGDDDPACLARITTLPRYGASRADASALADRAAQLGVGAREVVADAIGERTLAPTCRTGLARLDDDLRKLGSRSGSWRLLSAWLFELSDHLVSSLRADGDAAARVSLAATHVVLTVCEEQQAQGGRGAGDLLARLALVGSDDRATRAATLALASSGIDAVIASTIHRARDREFEVVHLAGVAAGQIPLHGRDVVAERSIFDLALSRARTAVCLSRALRYDDRTTITRPSLFLAAVGTTEAAAPTSGARPTTAKTARRPGRVHAEDDVAAYLACPALYRFLADARRKNPGVAQREPDGTVEEWHVAIGRDTLKVLASVSRPSSRGTVVVAFGGRCGPVPSDARLSGLHTLLHREAARRFPDRLIKVEALGRTSERYALVGATPTNIPKAYVAALAGIARDDFAPAPVGAQTCVTCPNYFGCC